MAGRKPICRGDEEINCFKENAYSFQNRLCNYTNTINHLRFGEYRRIKTSFSSRYSPLVSANNYNNSLAEPANEVERVKLAR